MDFSFDSSLLPDVFATCGGCVRESLDAAGLSLDCVPSPECPEADA